MSLDVFEETSFRYLGLTDTILPALSKRFGFKATIFRYG